MKNIIKRDGTKVKFQREKIATAISKAFEATGEVPHNGLGPDELSRIVETIVMAKYKGKSVDIETIQNVVEDTLMEYGNIKTAKAYILYREERNKAREKKSKLMSTIDDIVCLDAADNSLLRENANVNGDSAMGAMLKLGSESAKAYTKLFILGSDVAKAHESGDIHIHDLDFYFTGTTTCTQIDLTELFENGFSTGHGILRKPNSIGSYASLACIAIQSNQNDQH